MRAAFLPKEVKMKIPFLLLSIQAAMLGGLALIFFVM